MSNPPVNQTPVPMMRYILQLAGIIVILSAIVVAVTTLLNFEAPSAMGIITLIASLAAVTTSFVQREGRALLRSERVSLANGAAVITVVISAAFIVGVALFNAVPLTTADLGMAFVGDASLPWWVFPAGFVASAVFAWLVTYFTAGFLSRNHKKTMDKINAKKL